MVNEECWFIEGQIGKRRKWWFGKIKDSVRYEGSPGRVRFDIDYFLENREQFVGFVHTHPSFYADPSMTDDTTMKSLVIAVGRPLLCAIRGIDGLRLHWYLNDDDCSRIEVPINQLGNYYFGRVPNVSA